MSKVIVYPEQFITDGDFNRHTEFLQKYGYVKIFKEMTETYGIIKRNNNLNSLLIYNSSANKIGVRKGSAFTEEGNLIYIENDIPDLFELTDDNTFRKVFIQFALTQIENGTINTNGTAVVGNGTEFTKIFYPGKKIEIITVGTYEVLSVTNDTNLVLTSSAGINNSKRFKVQSIFTPDVSIPDGNKRPFWIDSFEISIENTSVLETNNKFCLARVKRNGGVVTIEDERLLEHKFKTSYTSELDADYTTASIFRVGGINGKKVLTEPNSPGEILNLKVVDIYGDKLNTFENEQGGLASNDFTIPNNNKLFVKVKWGYDDIEGYGGLNSFVITNENYDFANGILAEQYLWVSSINKNLKIINNVGNSLIVEEDNGAEVELTGLVISNTNPGILHPNADRYQIVAIPIKDNIQLEDQVVFRENFVAQSPVSMTSILLLNILTKYIIKVKAFKFNKETQFFELPSGSYMKYEVVQNYDKPILIKHPVIDDEGADIGLDSTRNGFSVTISGWNLAEVFEVCYTTENSGADFTNLAHNKILTKNKFIDISTSASANYFVKVRPLISGQQVSTPIQKQVVSGSAGLSPQDQVIASPYINHRTFSGTLSWNSGVGIGTLTSIVTPAFGTQTVTNLFDLEGMILTDSLGNNFLISSVLSSTTIELENLSGNSFVPEDGAFTIGVSKRGRLAYRSNQFPINLELVRVDVDCDIKRGENVTLRVYQEGREQDADSVVITASDTVYTFECDVLLLSIYGNRNLVIDLFDPADSSPKNKGCLVANVTVYARPYNKTRELIPVRGTIVQ